MSDLPVYTVKRSSRKTLSIYLERDGTISVLAPAHFTDEEIYTIVTRKNFQLYEYLAEREELNATRSLREIVSGETFPYLGRNYRLQLVDEQAVPLLLKEGYFCLKRADKDKAYDIFKDFYRSKGLPRITKRVRQLREQMVMETGQIRVMDLQHRWASCSPSTGDLNFHWKCLMTPCRSWITSSSTRWPICCMTTIPMRSGTKWTKSCPTTANAKPGYALTGPGWICKDKGALLILRSTDCTPA